MVNSYKYQALSHLRREIRLLKLLPKDGNEKFKFIPACHIFHTSLHENLKFIALSYVWGDTTSSRLIFVDKSPVRVNQNLYDAIMALRPLKEHILLWIDYLCINQSDAEEKSWQVRLMGDIYQKAEKVIAWLGPADSDSDSTVDYLNMVGAKADACGMAYGYEPYEVAWRRLAFEPRNLRDRSHPNIMKGTIAGNLSTLIHDEISDLFYSISGWHDQSNLLPVAGIRHFFTRPWWGRIWVLQEISLPENAEFLCGTKRVSRRRCGAALNAYCALRSVITMKFTNEPQSLTLYHLEILRNLFQHRPTIMLSTWRIYRYDKFSLAALLRVTCVGTINLQRHGPHNLESTDPRDKIFALLGLAADRDELESLNVLPDYSKTCKEIYETAMAALLQQGHISLLSCCQSPKAVPGLSSWAPDWSQSVTDMLQDVETDHITLYPQFSASGTGSCDSKITIIGNDDAIEGISVVCQIYDEIQEIGSFPARVTSHEVPFSETYSWPVQWLAEILRLSYGNDRYRDFSERLRAAARTSIGGVRHDQNTRLVRVGDDLILEALDLLQNGIKHIKENRIRRAVQRLLVNKPTHFKVNPQNAKQGELGPAIIGKSLGRLPFITRMGHLVLSSEHVKQGDFVALIKGGQVPFILRRQTTGQYQLIGEAYVDGIMDGEAMDDSKWNRMHLA